MGPVQCNLGSLDIEQMLRIVSADAGTPLIPSAW
jgi:hypothetical protein